MTKLQVEIYTFPLFQLKILRIWIGFSGLRIMGFLGNTTTIKALITMLLVLLPNAVLHVDGQAQFGDCIISCGQRILTCAAGCTAKLGPGMTSCYENCGTSDISCVQSCMGGFRKITSTHNKKWQQAYLLCLGVYVVLYIYVLIIIL